MNGIDLHDALKSLSFAESQKDAAMTVNFVFVDYENVQPDLLPMLKDEQSRVIVFVSAEQRSLPFALASAMQHMGNRAKYVQSGGKGKNALDFHIAFYIGALAARMPDARFCIISKDAGFDPLIMHLKTLHIDACRVASVMQLPFVAQERRRLTDSRRTGAQAGSDCDYGRTQASLAHPDAPPMTPPQSSAPATASPCVDNEGNRAHGKTKSNDETIKKIMDRLNGRNRPSTLTTLRRHLPYMAGEQIDVDRIIEQLLHIGAIAVGKDERVIHPGHSHNAGCSPAEEQ